MAKENIGYYGKLQERKCEMGTLKVFQIGECEAIIIDDDIPYNEDFPKENFATINNM